MRVLVASLVILMFLAVTATAQLPRRFFTNPPPAITLAWDQSPDTNVIRYFAYWGVESGVYTNQVGTGTNTVSITNLVKGPTYYFVVTAANNDGYESLPSNEISWNFLTNGFWPVITISVLFATPESTNFSAYTNAPILQFTNPPLWAFFRLRVTSPSTLQQTTNFVNWTNVYNYPDDLDINQVYKLQAGKWYVPH